MKKIINKTANVPKKPTIAKIKTVFKSPSSNMTNDIKIETESEILKNVKNIDLSNFFNPCKLS